MSNTPFDDPFFQDFPDDDFEALVEEEAQRNQFEDILADMAWKIKEKPVGFGEPTHCAVLDQLARKWYGTSLCSVLALRTGLIVRSYEGVLYAYPLPADILDPIAEMRRAINLIARFPAPTDYFSRAIAALLS